MKVIKGDFGKQEDERPLAEDVFELLAEMFAGKSEGVQSLTLIYEEGAPLLVVGNVSMDESAMLLMLGQQALIEQVYGLGGEDGTVH